MHRYRARLRNQEYVDHVRPVVLLALNTGLRRGELLNLKWQDVNLKTKWLTIAGQTSKNCQTRHLPLNAEAASLLEKWNCQANRSQTSHYVFASRKGDRMTTITTAWRSLRRLARLRNFHFHDLRHHFASRLVQSGVDLNSVRELLGGSLADIGLTLPTGLVTRLRPEDLSAVLARDGISSTAGVPLIQDAAYVA